MLILFPSKSRPYLHKTDLPLARRALLVCKHLFIKRLEALPRSRHVYLLEPNSAL